MYAKDMTLIDYFAMHGPKPNESDIKLQRLYDLNKLHNDGKVILRNEVQIECDLRYKWAAEMMKAKIKYDE